MIRRAFVTGSANGIGAAIVARLIKNGVAVVAADIDQPGLDNLRRELEVETIYLDVTDFARVADVIGQNGRFDILINNAGVDQHAFFTETTPADWRRLLAVNLEAAMACAHAALPAMQRAGYGRIINIASEAARLGSKGGAVYAAAKAGLIAFTKSLARENARFGITCNVVAPGPVRTPMLEAAIKSGGEKMRAAMTNATLLGRLGEPEEVAAAVGFLASEDAAFITGETLGVSGGMGIGG